MHNSVSKSAGASPLHYCLTKTKTVPCATPLLLASLPCQCWLYHVADASGRNWRFGNTLAVLLGSHARHAGT